MRFIDRIFKLEEINGDGKCPTYLYRWTLLSTPWFKIYLHHFVADDWSKDLHDHPKRFITIGLRGGYIEQVPAPLGLEAAETASAHTEKRLQMGWYRYWGAPWIRSFEASHTHRIIIPEGEDCWTLCIAFKAVRQWGFWANGKWVPWRQYVNSERADKMKSCS